MSEPTSSPLSETGLSPEDEDAARELLKVMFDLPILSRLRGTANHKMVSGMIHQQRLAAKREAHLQDARAGCGACKRGNPARSTPIYTDQPKPVRWSHRYPDQPDRQCLAGPIWDALSLLPPKGTK